MSVQIIFICDNHYVCTDDNSINFENGTTNEYGEWIYPAFKGQRIEKGNGSNLGFLVSESTLNDVPKDSDGEYEFCGDFYMTHDFKVWKAA
jgi:hypothetical protein